MKQANWRKYFSILLLLLWPMAVQAAAIGDLPIEKKQEGSGVVILQQRLAEAARIGFKTCLIPRHGTGNVQIPDGLEVVRVRNIREAIEFALPV